MAFTPLEALERTYQLIYLDPPWVYSGDPDKPAAAGKHYNMMTFEEMAALPVKDRLERPGVVAMWVTSPMTAVAIDLIRAWGLHFRGVGFVWIKTAQDGHIIEGQGVRPSFTKPTIEQVFFASTQKTGRPLPILDEGMPQPVYAPRGEHSEKPEEVRLRLQELFGNISRLEMFARARYQGWDSWGLEADAPMASIQAHSARLRARLEKYEANQELRDVTASLTGLPQE